MSYDPSKRYVWSPDEKIEITGQEFAMMLNAVRGVLNLPEAPVILMASKANDIMDKVMERYVSAGVIKSADQLKSQMKINEDERDDE